MQSIRGAALGVVVVLVLAACGGGGGGSDSADQSAAGECNPAALTQAKKPVDITMWHQMGSNNSRVFAVDRQRLQLVAA